MISHEGYLFANISSTVRFSCLYPKRKGQPLWETSSIYRKYPQNWNQITLPRFKEVDAYEVKR